MVIQSSGAVQCQRTRRFLSESVDGETWTCTYCDDHEMYRRLGPNDLGHGLVLAAVAMCRTDFGVEDDGLGTVVWLGASPETVFEVGHNAWHVYLARAANDLQHMYSGAHEAFHRVCTPHLVFHWVDEMLAVLFSLAFLERINQHRHADLNRSCLIEESARCPPEQMLAMDRVPYPDGMYGRAYVVGAALVDAVGWPAVTRLALARDASQQANIESWLDSLTPRQRTSARLTLEAEIGCPQA